MFRLPFTYSLGGGEFEKLKDSKDGHRKGTNNDCREPTECSKRKAPDCLKVADFMVGFARGGTEGSYKYLMPMLTLGRNTFFLPFFIPKIFFPKFSVDEPVIWSTTLDGTNEKPSQIIETFVDYSFKLTIDNNEKEWQTDVGDKGLDFAKEDPICFKKEDKNTSGTSNNGRSPMRATQTRNSNISSPSTCYHRKRH